MAKPLQELMWFIW